VSRAADGPASIACTDGVGPRHIDLRTDAQDLRLSAAADAWIEIRESRQTVSVGGPTIAEVLEIPLPLRFGSHWLKARRGDEFWVRRFLPGNADGSIVVAAHCTESPELQRQVEWLRNASAIAARVARPSGEPGLTALLEQTQALASSAGSASDAALARHLKAQALTMNERNADAGNAFAAAEAAWAEAGNEEGALAARLGRIEAMLNTAAYAEVLRATQPTEQVHEPKPYLFIRAQNDRCLALQYLSRLAEAEKCYEWTLAGYRRLREQYEVQVVLQTYAGVKRDMGDFDAAQRLGEQGAREASGPDAAAIRGRNLLMLADLALRRGEVARALQQLNAALAEFTAFKSLRWQANVYMKLADVYSELGSYDEAYSALGQALQRLNARDAAARVATATLSFAQLEHHNDHDASALWWSAAAEATFRRLGMPIPADAARVLAVSLQLDGAASTTPPALPPIEAAPAEDAGKWRLLRARLAIQRGDLVAAREELAQLARMPLALSDRLQAAVLVAEQQAAGGDAAAAQATLAEAAERVTSLAQRAHNDVLRYVIARQDRELRRTGLRLILDQPSTGADAIERVWRWLATQAYATAPAADRLAGAAHDDAFDRAVAAELLAGAHDMAGRRAEAISQRELLARLAAPTGQWGIQATAPLPSLERFRATLPAGAAFVAYVDGGTCGALLLATRDDARLLAAVSPAQLRNDVAALQVAMRNPGAALVEVRSATARLSSDLLGGAQSLAVPRQLYVLADPLSLAVPWSALAWPAAPAALVETTAIATVRFSGNAGAASAPAVPSEIRVVVSAQRDAATSSPGPLLAGAEVEAAQIRAALGSEGLRVTEDAQATRDTIDHAFAQPGAWIHVAAHGTAQPQRIGYAGLWLEPKAPETAPAFLSWIDVLDKGVRNDLVVLDACQSGDSGAAVNGNLSFADAVSRAGARRVVAVMWPVSDAASALWVPAFYAALTSDPLHDAPQALRAAQLRLRASRAFAHPFFWAGLLSLEQIDLPTSPPTAR